MDGRRFRPPPAAAQPLPPACAAEPSEDGEIFDSAEDDDLPSVRQILASSKQVIDLTRDDDGDPPFVFDVFAEDDDGLVNDGQPPAKRRRRASSAASSVRPGEAWTPPVVESPHDIGF